jgi:hypothetical protein
VAAFDEYIGKVTDFVELMRRDGSPSKEFHCPGSADEIRKGLPVMVGPGANPGIILRGDTFMELGTSRSRPARACPSDRC